MDAQFHLHKTRKIALLAGLVGLLALTFSFVLAARPVLAGHGGGGGGGGGCGMGCGGGASLATFVSNDFSGSGNCAMCHSALRDSTGQDVSLDSQWRSTMMANSGKDPLWQAKIESEVNRNPALKAVIEGKCSRCHTPMARVQAVADGRPVEVLGSGFLSPSHYLHAAALDSISCSLCHQIQAAGLGTPDTFTGNYHIDTSTSAPNRLIYAKFSNPMSGPMRMHVGYTPVQGAHTTSSGLCGSCHTLYTPVVDQAGNVIGEFPEQMTYPEWEHSAYAEGGQSCQGCHMPLASGGVKISNRPMRLASRSPFEQHYFVGANGFMLNLLKDNLAELGVTASASHLEATLARLNSQLQASTASLSVASAPIQDGALPLTLSVWNLAGHKLPSGIPARRAWIHLTVTDATGAVVFESGKPLTDGRIQGNDADTAPGAYEPHYELIQGADQVQIYEPVMTDANGNLTYTLLRAASYVKDNRLLPVGFDKTTASPEVGVYGAAYSDANFIGGSDQLTYVVDVQGWTAPFTVSAQLLYQAVSYSFASDLLLDQTSLVQRFAGFYAGSDKTPSLLASVQQVVP